MFHRRFIKNIVQNTMTRVSRRTKRNGTSRPGSRSSCNPFSVHRRRRLPIEGSVSASLSRRASRGPSSRTRMREKPSKPRPARGNIILDDDAATRAGGLRLATEERKHRPTTKRDGTTEGNETDRQRETRTERARTREGRKIGAWENWLTKRA